MKKKCKGEKSEGGKEGICKESKRGLCLVYPPFRCTPKFFVFFPLY